MATAEQAGPLLGALRAVPRTMLDAMFPDWGRRFRTIRELSESDPVLQAYSLGYRQDAARALAGAVHTRAGGQADEVRLRLTVKIFVAASRTPFLSWTSRGGEGGRAGLGERVDAAFAGLPAVLTEPA
ncbi:hypothetical protein ACFC63_17085 [Streptomyces albidoflavus]